MTLASLHVRQKSSLRQLSSIPISEESLAKLRVLRNAIRESDRLDREEENRDAAGAHDKWTPYLRDPTGFFEKELGYTLWSKQREICRALSEHDRVAVKSCHESGKSFTAGGIVGWWVSVHPPGEAMVVTTAPTFPQVRTILWKEVGRVHGRGGLPGRVNQTEWLLGNEVVAFGRKPSDYDPAAFQGLHARHLLVVIDEAGGVPKSMWDAVETLIANEGGKLLAIGNPDDPATEFEAVCRPGSGYKVITVSAFDTPNFTGEEVPSGLRSLLIAPEWVERVRKRHGESSPYYASKVLGQFPETAEDTLISPRFVSEAVGRDLKPDGEEVELGVDVARFGRNFTVIYWRRGPVARLWRAVHNRDTVEVTELVLQAVIDTGATVVKVDDAGIGGGVVDQLNAKKRERVSPNPLANCRVIGVNVGRAPIGRRSDLEDKPAVARSLRARGTAGGYVMEARKPDPVLRFVNLRSQLCWELRDRFVEGTIDLDPDDVDVQAQCTMIRYELRGGKIFIESKDDMEERMRRLGGISGESGSPDHFDALVLCYADVDAAPPVRITDEMVHRARAMPVRRTVW